MQSKILKKICAEISEINILQHIKKKKVYILFLIMCNIILLVQI